MIITVPREITTPCCMGIMSVDGKPFGVTLERPWLDNKRMVSAIPPGTYDVAFTKSYRFKRLMLEILKVPGRGGIRIHGANYTEELQGCLAVAQNKIRDGYIVGSLVSRLESLVSLALKRGEAVKISISNPPIA